MPRRTRHNRKYLKNKISKKQRGSGFSFGVDLNQIAGQPEVVKYSDCGSVAVPNPQDQSAGNLVGNNVPQANVTPDISTFEFLFKLFFLKSSLNILPTVSIFQRN